MTEDLVDLIGEDYEASGLSQRYKTIVALIDVVMGDPTSDLTPELKAELKDEFSPAELEELVLMAGVACGFSNLAIAWGAPRNMPIIEVPTPSPDSVVN